MSCFPLLGTLGTARAQLGGLPHRVHCLTLAGVNTCAGVLAAAHADMGGIPQCAQLHQHRFNPLGGSKHRTQYLLPHRARPRCPESPPRRRQPAPPSRLATSGPHRTPSKASKKSPQSTHKGTLPAHTAPRPDCWPLSSWCNTTTEPHQGVNATAHIPLTHVPLLLT